MVHTVCPDSSLSAGLELPSLFPGGSFLLLLPAKTIISFFQQLVGERFLGTAPAASECGNPSWSWARLLLHRTPASADAWRGVFHRLAVLPVVSSLFLP